MESCLKTLVWDAEAIGFQGPEKDGWEPMGPVGKKPARRSRLEANRRILATAGRPKNYFRGRCLEPVDYMEMMKMRRLLRKQDDSS